MKVFGFKDRRNTIGSFSGFTAFSLSAITAYPFLELFEKPSIVQSEISNHLYHGIIFMGSFLVYYFGLKAAICWHVVVTQKKQGRNISFLDLYTHTIDF